MFETILSARIANFTVDTTPGVNDVSIVPEATAAHIFRTAGNYGKFRDKDNVLIKSIAIVLPYCFTQSGDRLSVQMFYQDILTPAGLIMTEFGTDGKTWVFSENVEIELDVFWKWKNTELGLNTNTYFFGVPFQHVPPSGIGISYPRISMLNCPAGLNGTIQPVFCFLKCIHSLELDSF